MKKLHINYLLLLLVLVSHKSFSQTDCDEGIKKAKKALKNNSPFSDGKATFNLVKTVVETCDTPEAKNLLGLLYNEGIGTPIDYEKGFELLEASANADCIDAQFNLGLAYKHGLGCDLDYEKAIDWFAKASDNGHQKAGSMIGYMYYKGFAVTQDYEEAIHWFEKSEDTLAKRYLALCYYLGYGIAPDELKALEILADSESNFCQTLITHIKANQKNINEEIVTTEIENETNSTTYNLVESTVTDELTIESSTINEESILGTWSGKYLQYDWSGEHIVNILPFTIDFSKQGSDLTVEATINEQEITTTAIYSENNVHFLDGFDFDVDRLYHDEIEKIIRHSLLTIHFNKKELGTNVYLTGSVDSYIKKWEEYGRPSRVVLASENNTLEGELEDTEFLETLFEGQEQQFIKLYPVPFETELNVMYEITNDEEVYAELVNVNGGTPIVIQEQTTKPSGSHVYKIPISGLSSGLYVVRLIVGSQIHTRLVTKEN